MVRFFRKQLFSAFFDWLEVNKEHLGAKWYSQLYNEARNGESTCDNALKIVGTSMWMFMMIVQCGGVLAGIGPNNVNLQEIPEGLDERSTKRILNLIASCLSLQYLPKEIAEEEIPIISSKKFSLKLYTQG